ncbi:Hypothetical_protein [Hexamita inflata]|uniref:Hypothetical_protein n=1 Tax=Hexamita inflata TaxID=28002 RepID=A0AA86P6A5_9EUKA|nr:Hypothetical protein HINF_LOCUS18894 [Hexamita inflata]
MGSPKNQRGLAFRGCVCTITVRAKRHGAPRAIESATGSSSKTHDSGSQNVLMLQLFDAAFSREFSEPKTITILRFHFKDIEIAHRYFVAGLQSQLCVADYLPTALRKA